MSAKNWIIFLVVVVGLFVGLVLWSKNSSPTLDISSVAANEIQPASDSSGGIADQVLGDAASKVILIEYGDYQCPGCGAAHPGIIKLAEQYSDKIAFVFRNFPLTDAHPNAKAAAAAAEAAGLQGKFWEMHSLIYDGQSAWENLAIDQRVDFFAGYANELGLNKDQFVADMGSSKIAAKINFDKEVGVAAGVNSTPSFYLNGVKIESDVIHDLQTKNGELLENLIEAELKKV